MNRIVAGAALLSLASCKNVTSYTNSGDHYEGLVVQANFVRAGFDGTTNLCVVLDANDLQGAPGTISSSDGRFEATPLRPIPQIWHDPLSTFDFGQGRVQNMMYVATPRIDGGPDVDAMVVVSLMQGGNVEVRIVRGAPAIAGPEGAALFGVFSLNRVGGPCPF